MLDETTFRRRCDTAMDALKKSLIEAEEEGGFEVEEQNGVLNILFEDPPGKFVITPNTPARQVWISALSTSFKLDWSDAAANFVLPKTGETLAAVVERVIKEYTGSQSVTLD
jgi:iron donor protein CyaY